MVHAKLFSSLHCTKEELLFPKVPARQPYVFCNKLVAGPSYTYIYYWKHLFSHHVDFRKVDLIH